MADPAKNGFDSLPPEWKVVRLGDVAKLSSGGTPSKKRDDFWEGDIPWASPKDMKTPWLYDTQDHISQEGLDDGSRLVSAKSLFIVIRGMILAKDLPVSMAMVPMAFNQDMKAISTTDQLDPEFLLHAFSAFKSQLLPEIGTSAHGTRRIGTQAVEDFQVPLPSLEEQRAIAGVLRTVQRTKEATEKVIAAARQLKQSLMRHLFTYGPVPFHEADQVDLRESDIGYIPAQWVVSTLGDSIADGPQNGLYKPASFYGGGVPILRIDDYPNDGRIVDTAQNRVRLEADEIAKYGLQTGDIVVNRVNSLSHIAKTALIGELQEPTVFESNMMRFRTNDEIVDARFVFRFLCSDPCRRHFRGVAKRAVAQSSINQGDVAGVTLPLPSKTERQNINSAIDAIESKIEVETDRKSSLDLIFSTFLHELMTGHLRIDLQSEAPHEVAP